ncbi:protein-disulfide reductase DsbD family protein [Vulcaniibacterium tengchongense]|uniref:Thiol:disulfide interchange protein DsbD n=1 Tax=Vulcaniibacterium tengchongense TaxID=1273429 RepID=A0A3N4UYI6_9GAMM|nr:protein-disulfide reductase DsbD [Vulcaniibacterium tengchongense]RPE75786.1 thiol:disulfide interchange protein DsbD [Vulcaniibacterium tengchongense]
MTEPNPACPRAATARRLFALLAAALAGLAAGPAPALDPDELPPVDQVFALSAEATAPDRVEIRWQIADGYYLYRHRTAVQADAGFDAQPLQLPAGKAYRDEFFGDVETYRGELVAVLPGQARAARTTLKIRYQGCADAGVCYPPQTRTVAVSLPQAAAAAAPVPFGAGRGAGLGGGLLGAGGGAEALPLPPEQAFGFEAIARDGDTLLLRFTPARGYYLYRDRTSLRLDGAAGIAPGAPQWPPGRAYRDEHFGDVVVYFDEVEVPVPLRRSRADAATLQLRATFQGCQTDGVCYPPMTRTVAVEVPAGTVAPAAAAAGPGRAADAAPPPGPSPDAGAASPAAAGGIEAVPPASADRDSAASAPAAAARAETPPAARGAALGLPSALLLALLGGLILNLMPCVLPVLSLKALSLAGNGQDPARARRQALWYTAGVLLSFAALGATALALRQAGLALGWGFQLQQPLVVAVLALVMFGLGLSLSGLWHVGGRWTGIGHGLATRAGPAGDFFTGVLAVVVATPCTAPFMGAALAWAFAAPAPTALAVFLALGLGLALPFLLIGFVPALAHRLPRPGAWMETLKQLLAFPLYLTAAWLAWVLARQRGADAIGLWLLAAVLLAFAAWAWARFRGGRRWAGAAAALALLGLLWPLQAIQRLPRGAAPALAEAAQALPVVPYSEQRLADLRAAGRVVFVNVTADWCVTCKANEKAVFARDGFREALEAANAVYMVGDWTDVDPTLTAFLQRYKAVGVPLYVVFPRGGGEGRVLPLVLTLDTARQALAEAAQ